MPERDLAGRVDTLTTLVAGLSDSATGLSRSITDLAASQARIKKALVLTVIGLVVDFTLTVVAAFLINNQAQTNHRLAEANARIEAVQVRTSDQVLCPLYALFLAFEPRAKDNPQFTEQERQQRRDAYAVIHTGYATLGCH